MSPYNVCVVGAVRYLVGSVHILWATCICLYIWICGRFSWSAVHHSFMQVLLLLTFFLPSRLLSRSADPGSWEDVVCAAFRHIWCRNHPLLRKIGWGAICGARDHMFWMPRSILPSWVVYAAVHWQACLDTVSHSNPRESILGQLLEITFLNKLLGNVQ